MLPRSSLVLLAVLALGGCADYMNRRDSVTLGAGNALESNIALHTIDPFPEVAQDTDIDRWGSEIRKPKILVPVQTPPPSTAAN